MPKRILQGKVVSTANDKTVIVEVERKITDTKYKKIIRKKKRYAAHDPENAISLGEVVRIIESKPISKQKRWKVLGINEE